VIRLAVVAILVAVGFLMYRIGKEYEVMLDNKTAEIGGVKYEGMAYGEILIDGTERTKFSMWDGDRVIKKMVGSDHKLTIKVLNEDDDSLIKTAERDITIDFNARASMISIGAILGGAENIVVPNPNYSEPVFVPDDKPSQSPVDDGGIPEGDGLGDLTP
jgi:hypothetical protein